jgi:hypothetical protein
MPHKRPNANPMRPAEAHFKPVVDAPPVDEDEDAAADALIEGELFVIAVTEDPLPIVAPEEVPPIVEPDADADPEGVIVT